MPLPSGAWRLIDRSASFLPFRAGFR